MFPARALAFRRHFPNVLPKLAALALLLAAPLLSAQPAAAQITEQTNNSFTSTVANTSSVALSADGNTRLVGIPGESDKGRVHIYTRSGTSWTSRGELLDATADDGEHQGTGVAVSGDGNTALVVSENLAWIYTTSNGGVDWTLQAGQMAGGGFASLSADGNRALFGPTLWERDGGTWSAIQSFDAVSGALSADGKIVALGRPSGQNGVGVYKFNAVFNSWLSDFLHGTDEIGTESQGTSVAISADGKTVLSGAPQDDGGRGAVWVFSGVITSGMSQIASASTQWSQRGKLIGSGATAVSGMGQSVALSADGSTAIIGAPLDDDNGSASGALWAFTRNNGVWTQQGSKFFPASTRFAAGQSVAISGNAATIASAANSAYGTAAWVFTQPTVSVQSSLNPNINTQVVTFTATVNVATGTPTGDVTFLLHPPFGADVELDTVPLVSGQASFSTGLVDRSGSAISARYNGDMTFPVLTSGDLVQQVYYIDVLVESLTADINPSVAGQAVTFTVTLGPPPGVPGPVGEHITMWWEFPPGTFVNICEDVLLVSGTATCQSSSLPVGSLAMFSLGTDPCNTCNQGGIGLTQVVNKGATTTTLAADNNPAVPGQAVTFTATVAVTAPAAGTLTSTVTFKDGTTVLGTGNVSSGVATYSTSALSLGDHTITAHYDGDANFETSTSADVTQTLNQSGTTTTLSNSTSVFGEQVTLSATVTSGVGTPDGTVTFKEGATTLGSGTLASGTATFQTSALAVGTHTITAAYGGSTNFSASSDATHTATVNKGATTTTLASNHNPVDPGQSVTFTATVAVTAPAAGTRTGNVTFKDGLTTLGSGSLSGGAATYSTSALSAGSHTITASYDGDTNFSTSTSSSLAQNVGKRPTTTVLARSAATAKPGAEVTLTANVGMTAPASGTPTGSVTFKDGTTALGTINLASGKAIFKTSTLGIGVHAVTAAYGGDATTATSTSNANVTVDPKVGTEFRVNTVTANSQQLPAVAKLGSGFVTVWASKLQDGSDFGIYGQRYNAAGVKLNGEFRVNTITAGIQTAPAVASLTNGFVVVWESNGQDGSLYGIYGQRYNASGAKLGVEFRVNTTTINDQNQASVTGLPSGGFVVTWTSNGQDRSGLGIIGQRYNAAGVKAGTEFLINTTVARAQSQSSVTALGAGFVVAWQSDIQDGSGFGIYAQRFTTAGAKAGGEFRVNAATANAQSLPSVAGLSDGGFIVAWQSAAQDGSGLGVYARRYTAAGGQSGQPFLVNTRTAGDQSQPSVAAFADGGFIIAWTSAGQDGSGMGVYAQVYGANSLRANIEFRTNTMITDHQYQASAAAMSAGNFVTVWTSRNQDGSMEGVYGQRFQFIMH
jgi:hypothetical protein